MVIYRYLIRTIYLSKHTLTVTKGAIKNGQSRDTGNFVHKTKKARLDLWLSFISFFFSIHSVFELLSCELSKPNYVFKKSMLCCFLQIRMMLVAALSAWTATYLSYIVDKLCIWVYLIALVFLSIKWFCVLKDIVFGEWWNMFLECKLINKSTSCLINTVRCSI